MPKYRQLHLKILDSIDVNDMPDDFTRLTWVLLCLIVDSEGRGIDNPAWVRSKMYPLRIDVELSQIGAAMDWLENRKMVTRYCVDGRKYFLIPTWSLYQTGTEREGKSSIPAPVNEEGNSRPTQDLLASNSGPTQDLVPPNQPINNQLTTNARQEQGAPSDTFSKVQRAIEKITGMMPDPGAVNAINEIIGMGANREDVQNGYKWLRDQKKTFRYYGQLVGPTRTAMAVRIGKSTPAEEPMTEERYRREAACL